MKITVRQLVIFAMLGALMYASKAIMAILPNIHLIGVFIISITVVYRTKALFPIYVFVFATGLFDGFGLWWIPHLYIWTILWAAAMLLPKKLPKKIKPIVYMVLCSLHGFLYGVLYAPAQALLFGLNFDGMIAWIISGLPFDFIHGISNFFCAMLVVPFINIIQQCERAGANT